MTTRPAILAALMPFLTVAVMLWSASCSRAQVPPVENQLAGLLDWRLVLRAATANSVEVSSRLVVRQPVTLSFDNTNSQPLDVTVQTSTNLVNWTQATNALAPAKAPFEWVDTDVNRAQKFYRVQVNWWF